MVEQRTLNPLVEGSNPSRPTSNFMKIKDFLIRALVCFVRFTPVHSLIPRTHLAQSG
ncbi:hypothetical protein CARN8_5340001 [mine drainage metagenome]|uniref:Uncharacterized protein n=1 Tax=mine drainage metagenome TaxID=410659 RepID=A0A3P3ZQQ2_9ZZZZ